MNRAQRAPSLPGGRAPANGTGASPTAGPEARPHQRVGTGTLHQPTPAAYVVCILCRICRGEEGRCRGGAIEVGRGWRTGAGFMRATVPLSPPACCPPVGSRGAGARSRSDKHCQTFPINKQAGPRNWRTCCTRPSPQRREGRVGKEGEDHDGPYCSQNEPRRRCRRPRGRRLAGWAASPGRRGGAMRARRGRPHAPNNSDRATLRMQVGERVWSALSAPARTTQCQQCNDQMGLGPHRGPSGGGPRSAAPVDRQGRLVAAGGRWGILCVWPHPHPASLGRLSRHPALGMPHACQLARFDGGSSLREHRVASCYRRRRRRPSYCRTAGRAGKEAGEPILNSKFLKRWPHVLATRPCSCFGMRQPTRAGAVGSCKSARPSRPSRVVVTLVRTNTLSC